MDNSAVVMSNAIRSLNYFDKEGTIYVIFQSIQGNYNNERNSTYIKIQTRMLCF